MQVWLAADFSDYQQLLELVHIAFFPLQVLREAVDLLRDELRVEYVCYHGHDKNTITVYSESIHSSKFTV